MRRKQSSRIVLNYWVFCSYEEEDDLPPGCLLARFFIEEDAFDFVARMMLEYPKDIHYTIVNDEPISPDLRVKI